MRISQQQPESVYVPDLPRPVPDLHDLVLVSTPDGDLAHPDYPDAALGAEQVADYARSAMTAGGHLRLLIDDGARHEALLGLVAEQLGCDVLVAPAGASVDLIDGADGAVGEAVPVDRASGEVVDWALVQPAGLATTLPGWFDLVGGLVLPRTGLATLTLPEGIEFVTGEDFVTRRAAAAQLGQGHPDLVTVAVTTGGGGFRLPAYGVGDTAVPAGLGGRDLAAALSEIQLYGGDLRLWLRWPDDPAERHQIGTEIAALAETTGTTVWAPAAGGEAVLLRGCRDLGARDRAGNVTRWQEYRPPYARVKPRFTTDLDGRLVPAAGPAAGSLDAVTVVSTRRQSPTTMRSRYAGLTAEQGSALLDLSLLADGRLALCYVDGSCLAVDSGVLRALLVNLGWSGADLLLLTPVPPDAADGLSAHLAILEAELRVEIWSLPPGTSVVVQDGLARAVDGQRRPADWLRAGQPGPAPTGSRWYTDDGCLLPVRRGAVRPTVPAPAPLPAVPAAAAPPPHRMLPAPSPYRVAVSSRVDAAHRVPWMPENPLVNTEPVRLWLSCPAPPGRAAVEGIPTANLFLVGDLDGTQVAQADPGAYLLCLRVGAGCAIDLSSLGEVPDDVPDDVRRGLGDVRRGLGGGLGDETGRFLLPAAWLDRVHLLAGYRLDDAGRPDGPVELPAEPVLLRCTGAGHGIDGLPDEAVHWPGDGHPGHAWVVLPPAPGVPEGDVLEAWLRRPAVRAGHRLARVRLDAGTAIDVAASAAVLTGLVSVRTRLPELLVAGVDLVLPPAAYDHARVDQVRYADGDHWRQRGARRVDLPLSALFESDPS
ncbi:hypothetical protein [Micromonospora sp. NBC_01813]|uniref:hypothetical protein n=1 Tax=Micromonospora sp. NBC_01813 TaxID=2975988 RepID=UPI002DDB6AC9|nr:hypothetical protein [Micromonospora sp. NBC_01813]WSA07719.1 hypothetical protein OG958_26370 [Micromonospora sp. NBC_01813]